MIILNIVFPKVATRSYLENLTQEQIQAIIEYTKNTIWGRASYVHPTTGKKPTLAEYLGDWGECGVDLKYFSDGHVTLHDFSHGRYNTRSGKLVTCFYALVSLNLIHHGLYAVPM